jgi:hypothetical protein
MSRPTPAPLHRVEVADHTVDRWQIAALTIAVPAVDVDHARLAGVQEAHRRAGVPPWRPFRRVSLAYAKAERVHASRAAAPTGETAFDVAA